MNISESFSFIHNIVSEELIFEYFPKFSLVYCHDNQSNGQLRNKIIYFVEDHSINISDN